MTDSSLAFDGPAAAASATPTEPVASHNVGLWLGIAIFLAPVIFAWFTLRRGCSRTARVCAFVWLFVYAAIQVDSAARSHEQASAEGVAQTAEETTYEARRHATPTEAIDQYADRIENAGGICIGIAGQLRMIVNNFGPEDRHIADVLGKAEQYHCL